jgi:hypothetical protein
MSGLFYFRLFTTQHHNAPSNCNTEDKGHGNEHGRSYDLADRIVGRWKINYSDDACREARVGRVEG